MEEASLFERTLAGVQTAVQRLRPDIERVGAAVIAGGIVVAVAPRETSRGGVRPARGCRR